MHKPGTNTAKHTQRLINAAPRRNPICSTDYSWPRSGCNRVPAWKGLGKSPFNEAIDGHWPPILPVRPVSFLRQHCRIPYVSTIVQFQQWNQPIIGGIKQHFQNHTVRISMRSADNTTAPIRAENAYWCVWQATSPGGCAELGRCCGEVRVGPVCLQPAAQGGLPPIRRAGRSSPDAKCRKTCMA